MPPKRRPTKKASATDLSGNEQPAGPLPLPETSSNIADPTAPTLTADALKLQSSLDATIVETSVNTVPVQIPTGRLDSLNRSNSGSRIGPGSVGEGSTGGAASTTAGSSARPKLKYAPKSTIRKSKQ